MCIRGISQWIQWNIGLIGDGSAFQGYFVIFWTFFQEQRGGDCGLNVLIHSHYGYCKPICTFDYIIPYACMLWSEGCLHLLLSWNSPSLLILAVYCVIQIHQPDVCW